MKISEENELKNALIAVVWQLKNVLAHFDADNLTTQTIEKDAVAALKLARKALYPRRLTR